MQVFNDYCRHNKIENRGVFMGKMSKFNERLMELFQAREITTKQLSEAIDVNGSTVCLWLEGKRNIRLRNAIKLCDYFNCSLGFLIGRTETILDFIPKPAYAFYDRLRGIMADRGVSRYRIVNDLKKSHRHFDRWKAGNDPFLETVIDLADYFEMSIDFFIGRER